MALTTTWWRCGVTVCTSTRGTHLAGGRFGVVGAVFFKYALTPAPTATMEMAIRMRIARFHHLTEGDLSAL